MTMDVVFVVRDASGEYIKNAAGERTPSYIEAMEFDTLDAAQLAMTRATDRVLTRKYEAV
jgi:hypothetical protein